MALKVLQIDGLRGFATPQEIRFSCPTERPGSGLTVLVGANNAGKSTVVEALRALVQRDNPSFTQGRRNRMAGDRVRLRLEDAEAGVTELRSVLAGTSETERVTEHRGIDVGKVLVLPSRRTFNPYFGKSESSRGDYMAQIGFPAVRSFSLDQFSFRLFRALKNREAFNEVLGRVLNPVPHWTIDQHDTGQYFLKIALGDTSHSSEGLGEGLVSLFFIVDALYDSTRGDTIVIDEPELSLHPLFQRKLATLLTEFAADRQIILATHSPYFVNLVALENGATVCRAHLKDGKCELSQLSDAAIAGLTGMLTDLNNPHVFGLNAQEVFFLDDQVILVEGQEDVIFYDRVQRDLGMSLEGTFFGWGVGGASKMEHVARVLRDLGFEKVVGVLDANKGGLLEGLRTNFPEFRFFTILADDVRTKDAVNAKEAVEGLLDDKNAHVRANYQTPTRELFAEINRFLAPNAIAKQEEPVVTK